VAGRCSREQRRLVEAALGEARRVKRHGDDEVRRHGTWTGLRDAAPQELAQGSREVGAPVVFEMVNRARQGTAENEGSPIEATR
jgi:hypothetical protein